MPLKRVKSRKTTKYCCKCDRYRLHRFFYKMNGNYDGLDNYCKECSRKRGRDWYAKNSEKERLRWKIYREANKEKYLETNRRWCKKNPERRREINRKSYFKHRQRNLCKAAIYRKKNREKIRASNRIATKKWYQNNKEYHKKLRQAWNKKNIARRNLNSIEWKRKNPEKAKLIQRNANHRRRVRTKSGQVTHEEWIAIKIKHKHRCAYCKKRKPLTMDHVVPVSKGGKHHAKNIKPACQSCNSRKSDKINWKRT